MSQLNTIGSSTTKSKHVAVIPVYPGICRPGPSSTYHLRIINNTHPVSIQRVCLLRDDVHRYNSIVRFIIDTPCKPMLIEEEQHKQCNISCRSPGLSPPASDSIFAFFVSSALRCRRCRPHHAQYEYSKPTKEGIMITDNLMTACRNTKDPQNLSLVASRLVCRKTTT